MIRTLYTFLVAFTFIASCSSDTGETTLEDSPEEIASLVGVWDAVEYRTTEPIDYNVDGIDSYDIMEEIDCFFETWTFNENGTYSGTIANYTASMENVASTCVGNVDFSGNYVLKDNELTINRSDGSSYTVDVTLTKSTFSHVQQSFGLGVLTMVNQKRE